ncbi:Crp/Fnr family transcriptional regulator [Calothrix parietina]|uniref:Crp/Fnr family transcriptional regulator n=3 Tax=Calothrix TaxID=1186 RepID=A0ABR8AAC1_9CYAN|nr:Crp/Fnr family transcriptional regulator [Calothrix parietina]MBD2196956.1 Crp/Fnr family transcriptional regulator [Calothrix parietina FACHB-288]MBD2225508.1 Crp/Fnr family transcriptional regulator [Calothrix anomala FACHB-343]
MSNHQDAAMVTQNRLLAQLPPDELNSLYPHLEIVSLSLGQVIIEAHEPIPYAYFPVNSLLSLVAMMEDGSTVESGCIGREGMAGVPIILDASTTPMQTLAQIPGKAVRIKAGILKEAFKTSNALQKILYRYIHTVIVLGSQSTGCNRLHNIEARLSRWLLMSSDGIGSESLPLTQEFLSTMLGVRRSGVSETASKLQSRGLISYQRGNIQIVDRKGLETTACECYGIVKAEYQRLFN